MERVRLEMLTVVLVKILDTIFDLIAVFCIVTLFSDYLRWKRKREIIMVDMAALNEGDTIVIRGQEVKITSIERNERGILINGGLDNGGYDFGTDDTTVWYECGYSDSKF